MKTYKTDAPRITLAMLKGACKEQRDIFRAEWPEGVDVTIENVRRAQELGLALAWGEHWFTVPAKKAYREATAPARKAYLEAIDEAIAPARKVYNEAIAQAWKAYDEATAPARKAYDEAIATAWVAAYIQSVAEREAQPSKAS
ncbi:MAG: hypothetical protein IPI85_16310 [Dehalococcoidia bacterium]|nr:hypothetical protein [Dehalococcoidia bacterium]